MTANSNCKFVLERLKFPESIILEQQEYMYSCGRGKENKIVCSSLTVSRKHCTFLCLNGNLFVMDLKSSNGLFINGQLQQPHEMIRLYNNDIVGIGCCDINDRDTEIREKDKFVYRLRIVAEVHENSLSDSTHNNELILQQSKDNEDTTLARKRVQEVNENIVPNKIPRLENTTPKSNYINVRNENDIEIVHVSLSNDQSLEAMDKCDKSLRIPSRNINKPHTAEVTLLECKKLYNKQVKKQNNKNVEINKGAEEFDNTKDMKENPTSLHNAHSVEKDCVYFDDNISTSESESKMGNKAAENGMNEKNLTNKFNAMQNLQSEMRQEYSYLSDNTPSSMRNIAQYENTAVKYEEAIEIVDTDEQENIRLANSSLNASICAPSPIKLKEIKQELKTRFSEVDVVNLTDDEDDVFPCSQIFDIGFGRDASFKEEFKEEIKEEPVSKENDRFQAPEDEDVISLSDSEDEDNPWLKRLSRSQILNESADENLITKTIKQEIIDEECGLSLENAMKSKVEDTPLSDLRYSTKSESDNLNVAEQVADINVNEVISSSASPTHYRTDLDVVDKTASELEKERIPSIEKSPQNLQEPTSKVPQIKSPSTNKNVSLAKRKSLEKKIPEVEPAFLPVGRKRSVDGVKQKVISGTTDTPKLTRKEKRELKLKAKQEERLYKIEQKRRKQLNKWADALPPGQKKSTNISKEEKKTLAEIRKAKLKEIAEEEKRLSLENKHDKKRGGTKVKAKVTLKNRGEFLINEHLALDSCASTSETGKKKPTVTATTSAENTKEMINKVSDNLQNYLKVSEVPKKIKIPKKSSATKGSTEDITDKVKNCLNLSTEKSHKQDSLNNEKCKPQTLNQTSNEDRAHHKAESTVEKEKPKKRVTFSEKLRAVHIFEIDTGNTMKKFSGKDAPIPLEKLPVRPTNVERRCPKLEEFLLRIFSWKPVWLEEQRRFNTIAPAVPENELVPLLSHYKSYEDYYKIVAPLLLLEIWCGITKEFETVERYKNRPPVMCSIVANSVARTPIPESNEYLSILMLEVLVSKEDSHRQAHPVYGDLVFFEYTINHGKQQSFHKIFAYVTNVHKTVLTPNTHFNKDLLKHVKHPYALLTYTMQTKPLENNICVNRVQRLKSVTYLRASIRLVQALQYLPKSPLMKSILSPHISLYHLPTIPNIQMRSLVTKDNLNPRQLEAVFKITDTVVHKEPKVCFIQGPPGTGKSTVILNIITQILYGENRYKSNAGRLKILVCAPSNAAIDELVLRLLSIRAKLKENRFKMVRIGRPETMHPVAKDISLTELAKRDVKRTTASYASNQISNASVEEEMSFLQAKINAMKCEISSNFNSDDASKKYLKMKLTDTIAKYDLLKNCTSVSEISPRELTKLQYAAENRLLQHADIIACTLSSCYTNQMESIFGGKREKISVCIVDEATQSCEAETLIPLMLGVTTLVLVGDTNQLPATVISQRAKRFGLDQSIFARVQTMFDGLPNNPMIWLDTQYRMSPAISYWPNMYFYAGRLKNEIQMSLMLPFHQYRIFNLNATQNTDKFSNTDEAQYVANLIVCMISHSSIESRKTELSFGVITPYQAQRGLILEVINGRISSVPENMRKKVKIDVNTVDAFQGQERDIIIMSCVRSNGIGFLSDRQRLCVALTRAKHCLVLCGNFNTFMRDQMWNALLSDAKSRGVYHDVNAQAHPNEIRLHIMKSGEVR